MLNILSKNILIYGVLNALKSLVPLLMLPILTRYMSIEDFGVLSLIETNILFLMPFILLNINSAINVEYHHLSRYELKQYITNSITLSMLSFLFCSLIFFFFRGELSNLLHLTKEFVIFLSVFAFLRVISTVVLGVMQISQRIKSYFLYTIFQVVVDIILTCFFVIYIGSGLMGRLEGVYITFFITSIIGFYYLYTNDYLSRINFKFTKNILAFGLPLIPHAIGGTIMAMSDRYFISYYVGNEFVGYYTVAYQMSALMLLVSLSVNQAWVPILFNYLRNGNKKNIVKITIILSALFTLVALIIYLLKDVLFYIFVSEDYFVAKEYFLYLLLGFLFQSFYFLATNTFFYMKKTSLLAIITVLGASLNLLLNYLFIKNFGVIGVAYATSLTWLIFLISVISVKYILNKS